MGAYSRWALIRGWALIRINTVSRFQGAGIGDEKNIFLIFLVSFQTAPLPPPQVNYLGDRLSQGGNL